MAKYRTKTDIIAVILSSAANGATKTKIMYNAYISYPQLKSYLAYLLENGLLERERGSNLFQVTEKGRQFLRAHDDMRKILPLPELYNES